MTGNSLDIRKLFAATAMLLASTATQALSWSDTSPPSVFQFTDEITNVEYAAYLNADDSAGGPNEDWCGWLWNQVPPSDPNYPTHNVGDTIQRTGGLGSRTYTALGNVPMRDLTLVAAMAYANWTATGDSRSGAYDIFLPAEASEGCTPQFPTRNSGSTIWVLSEAEYDAIGTSSTRVNWTDTHEGSGFYTATDGTTDISTYITAEPGDVFRLGRPDSDSDGIPDVLDKCVTDSRNASLTCDTDQDGYGNPCDGDFNQSNTVTSADYSMFFVPALGGPDPGEGEDMNCSGTVTSTDYSMFFVPQHGNAPGPSGLGCAGTIPCP